MSSTSLSTQDQWWKQITPPEAIDQESVRKEFMCQVILLMAGIVAVIATILVAIITGWVWGEIDLMILGIMLVIDASIGLGHWLLSRRRWEWAIAILIVILFLLGLYGNLTVGLVTNLNLAYVLAIVLAVIFYQQKLQLILLGLCLVLPIVAQIAHGNLPLEDWISAATTYAALLVSIALLQWFAANQWKRTVAQARDAARELQKYQGHLADLVAERSAELIRTNEQLRTEIEQHRQTANELEQQTRDLTRSHSFITALHGVTARVESTRDPDQVLAALGGELQALGLTCVVALREGADPGLVVRYSSISPPALAQTKGRTGFSLYGYRIPPEIPFLQQVVDQARPYYVTDTQSAVAGLTAGMPGSVRERVVGQIDAAPELNAVYLPLMVEERGTGLLITWGVDVRKKDLPALSVFAGQVAGVLERARLFQAERQRSRELTTLLEATRAISSTIDLEETLRVIAEQMVRAIDVAGCTISRWDRQAGTVTTWIEWRTEPETAEERGRVYPLEEFPATRAVLETGQPHIVQVADPEADAAEVARMLQVGSKSLLMLPLAAGERAIGLLELDVAQHARDFSPDEIQLCQAMSNQAAVAIENVRLYESVRRELGERLRAEEALKRAHDELEDRVQERTAELQNLQRITNALLSLEELDQVMASVAKGIVTHLGYDMVLVSRHVEQDEAFTGMALHPVPGQDRLERVVRLLGYPELMDDPSSFRVAYHRAENPSLDRVLDGETVISTEMADIFRPWVHDAAAATAQKVLGLQTFVNTPMRVKDQTVGTIVAGVRAPSISDSQQQALLRVAGQAAVAIENARLFEAERQWSAELERSNAFVTALSQVAARIEATPDPDRVLATLGEELGQLGITCFLGLLKPDGRTLVGSYTSIESRMLALIQKMAGMSLADFRIPRERWPIQQVLAQGQALYVPDLISATAGLLPQIPKRILAQIMRQVNVRPDQGAIYLPLKIKERELGIMTVWGGDLKQEDVPALLAFASQVAVAFENARLYDQAQQEVAARLEVEEQIRSSLAEKEILLKEIHHRVKNNLQIISSLLSLQADHIQDPEALASFRDSQSRIRSMALIHERLYRAPDLARIDFGEYVQNLATYLFRVYSARTIQLDMQARDVLLDMDIAVSCGLIVNEIISNSLKHAFPAGREGKISIRLKQAKDGTLTIEIADDGIGLRPDLDIHTTDSLGLQLVSTLVDQLDGTIDVKRQRGTRFQMTFAASRN